MLQPCTLGAEVQGCCGNESISSEVTVVDKPKFAEMCILHNSQSLKNIAVTRKVIVRKTSSWGKRAYSETYSFDDADRDCMMSNYHIYYSHGLAEIDFSPESNTSFDNSVSESETEPNISSDNGTAWLTHSKKKILKNKKIFYIYLKEKTIFFKEKTFYIYPEEKKLIFTATT